MSTIPDTVRATVGEHAATVGETVARRYFAGNALTRAARLTERDLAMIAATAAHVALTAQPRPDYRALWEAWEAGTLDPSASSEATLAAALTWNDRNGDYDGLAFPDLLESVAQILSYNRIPAGG